jgi:hypothetical protein
MALSSAQRALRVAPANKRGTPARLQRMQRGALRVAAASATVRLILDCALAAVSHGHHAIDSGQPRVWTCAISHTLLVQPRRGIDGGGAASPALRVGAVAIDRVYMRL